MSLAQGGVLKSIQQFKKESKDSVVVQFLTALFQSEYRRSIRSSSLLIVGISFLCVQINLIPVVSRSTNIFDLN